MQCSVLRYTPEERRRWEMEAVSKSVAEQCAARGYTELQRQHTILDAQLELTLRDCDHAVRARIRDFVKDFTPQNKALFLRAVDLRAGIEGAPAFYKDIADSLDRMEVLTRDLERLATEMESGSPTAARMARISAEADSVHGAYMAQRIAFTNMITPQLATQNSKQVERVYKQGVMGQVVLAGCSGFLSKAATADSTGYSAPVTGVLSAAVASGSRYADIKFAETQYVKGAERAVYQTVGQASLKRQLDQFFDIDSPVFRQEAVHYGLVQPYERTDHFHKSGQQFGAPRYKKLTGPQPHSPAPAFPSSPVQSNGFGASRNPSRILLAPSTGIMSPSPLGREGSHVVSTIIQGEVVVSSLDRQSVPCGAPAGGKWYDNG